MSCKPKPAPRPARPLKSGETPKLGDSELAGFDAYTKEHIRTIGTPIEYYSLDIKGSKRDPLYDEPIARVYKPVFKLYAFVRWPNPTFTARDDGSAAIFATEAWIARKEVEEINMPIPKPGDTMRFWNVPFFNQGALVNGKDVQGSGYFFDVLNVADDGHLFDTPAFTTFKLALRRKTEFAPERKIYDY